MHFTAENWQSVEPTKKSLKKKIVIGVLFLFLIFFLVYYFKFSRTKEVPKILETDFAFFAIELNNTPDIFNSYLISYKNKTFTLYHLGFSSENKMKNFIQEFKDYGESKALFSLVLFNLKDFGESYAIHSLETNTTVGIITFIDERDLVILLGHGNDINSQNEIINWFVREFRK